MWRLKSLSWRVLEWLWFCFLGLLWHGPGVRLIGVFQTCDAWLVPSIIERRTQECDLRVSFKENSISTTVRFSIIIFSPFAESVREYWVFPVKNILSVEILFFGWLFVTVWMISKFLSFYLTSRVNYKFPNRILVSSATLLLIYCFLLRYLK